jgi:hypothetical protein
MRRLFLSVIGLYVGILSSFSQNTDSAYKKRKLTFEEANFVSSYYRQNGNNAATTGGTGSEKLSDFANTIDVKVSWYNKHNKKQSVTTNIGIDHYTSASSDKIDPTTISSASHADTRIYPSISFTSENENKGTTAGTGLSFSAEYDYTSFGANLNFAKKTNNRNGEFSAKAQAFVDKISLIYPIELRAVMETKNISGNRNTFSGSISWSQIINQQLQVLAEGELVYQHGYLGLPFHRVYFKDHSVNVENLPSTRLKIPVGLRANYFLGDKFILRMWYRYYYDDWGITSNALQVETVLKLTPFFSVTPFYRFYQQSAADYFESYGVHTAADNFFTSNYDLSKFNSNFFGTGFRIAPPNGVLKIQHLNAVEMRYGHYKKTTGMNSDIISLDLKLK